MNIFDELKYENIAVHCDTKEKANKFLKALHDNGFKCGLTKEKLIQNNIYEEHKDKTCYSVLHTILLYGDVEGFKSDNFKIITFDDFMKSYVE